MDPVRQYFQEINRNHFVSKMKKFQSVHADNMKEERAKWKLKLMEIMDSNSVEIWGFLLHYLHYMVQILIPQLVMKV